MDMTIKVQESTDEEIKRIEDTISLYWAMGWLDQAAYKEIQIPRIIDPTGRECAVVDWDTGYILWGYSGKEREEWRRWLEKMLATEVCTYATRFDTFGAGNRPSVRMGTFMRMHIQGDVVTFDGVTTKPARILDHTDTHITLKHQGENYWAARGVQGYAPAEIKVYDTTQAEHRITEQGNVSYAGNMPVKASWEIRSKARHENCRACKKLQS